MKARQLAADHRCTFWLVYTSHRPFGPGVMLCLSCSLLAQIVAIYYRRSDECGGKIEVEEELSKTVRPADNPASSTIPDVSRCPTSGLAADASVYQPPESTLLLAVSPCMEDIAFLTQTFRETTWKLCEARTYREAFTVL